MTCDGTVPQIDDSGLPQYGEDLARALSISGRVRGGSVSKGLIEDMRFLHERRVLLASGYASGETVPAFAEWLLDNYYLVQREGLISVEALRASGGFPAAGGSAALFSLCAALVRSGGGRVTPERAALFLDGCQQAYVLSRRELTYFLPLLKAAAISELAALYASKADGEAASSSADRLFSTLRALSTRDFSGILERVDRTEQCLRQDPAGVYSDMSEKTRASYKKRVEMLARLYRISEHRIARHILDLAQSAESEARHVGYWLFIRPMGDKKHLHSGSGYISVNVLVTLLLSLSVGIAFKNALAGLLVLLPLSELVKTLTDELLLTLTPPAHIPRMALAAGVPPSGRTVCVISALLAGADSGAALARRLEEYRLASRDCGDRLLFGLLADLPDSKTEKSARDGAAINAARSAIDALNKKYGGGFF
ncbi:MAG: hypothetical protein LBL15_00715, partial [Oscillospiraceae bacterium]|nr:hypothetical protein [Oscillospiraceae bacterium]